jgi:hypothetical protein
MRSVAMLAAWLAGAALAAAETPGGGEANPNLPAFAARISGEILHANTLEFAGLAFRDVVAKPQFVGATLDFTDCQATAYGGTVTGEIQLNIDTGTYHCRCEVAGIDLGTVLSEFGGNNAGISGVVAGHGEFDIPAHHPEQLTGSGELTVSAASLVQLPILANLLIGDPSGKKGKDSLIISFTCNDGHIHIKKGVLNSPACRIMLSGSIAYDGDLRIGLEPNFKFDLFHDVPGLGIIVAPLLGNLSSHVARAVIRGQLTKPVLIINPFLKQN